MVSQVKVLAGRAGQTFIALRDGVSAQYADAKRLLVLVPEQFTLQCERELIFAMGLKGSFKLQVLSPRRLRERILQNAGRDPLQPLDPLGRGMALGRAVTMCRDDLQYYRRVADTAGLPVKLASLIDDIARAELDPAGLRALAEQMPGRAIRTKLNDLAMLWDAYHTVVDGRFADETAQQAEALRRLPQANLANDADVWVYGFDELQPPMCALLSAIAALSRSVTVTMTMDGETAPDGHVFLAQRRSVGRLTEALARRQIPCRTVYLTDSAAAERAPVLAHLQKNLFARAKWSAFDGDCSPLTMFAAQDPFHEAEHGAQVLRRWYDAGIPWSGMAVAVSGAPETALLQTLAAAGIPVTSARQRPVRYHGLCRMLIFALRSACDGYHRADVLNFARSGFSPLTEPECAVLCTYAVENGIDRSKWLNPFVRPGFEEAEPLRRRLIAPLQNLQTGLRQAKTAAQSVTAIFGLLQDVEAWQRLQTLQTALQEAGLQQEVSVNRQVWQFMLDLLDQLYALLGESRAVMADIHRYMETAVDSYSLHPLPQNGESVLVGEAGHILMIAPQAVLIMGLQEGVMSTGKTSLITQRQRAEIGRLHGRAVGIDENEENALRRSDFYRTVALPVRYLSLSWSTASADGSAMLPASMVSDVCRIVPGVHVEGGLRTADESGPIAPATALQQLALMLRGIADGSTQGHAAMTGAWQDALRYLWHSDAYGDVTRQMLTSLEMRDEERSLSPQSAARLFGSQRTSISRLETYHACPYQHFVTYGLKPKIPREFQFLADEKGSFSHDMLERFVQTCMTMPDWPNIDEETIDRILDQQFAEAEKGWQNGPLRDDAVGGWTGQQTENAVRRSAHALIGQAAVSDFRPVMTQAVFGDSSPGSMPPVVLTLPDGHQVALQGKIDRIDRFDSPQGVYLRVVDYKSSKKDLQMDRLWNGLQLQLMLYLHAAEAGQDGKPAGALYFTVSDPQINPENDTPEAARKATMKEMRMRGVVLDDPMVIQAMDKVPGTSMNAMIKKDGSVRQDAGTFKAEELQMLMDLSKQRAAEAAWAIRQGSIDPVPARDGRGENGYDACRWCDFASVCPRDDTVPGCREKRINPISAGELLQKLSENPADRHPD